MQLIFFLKGGGLEGKKEGSRDQGVLGLLCRGGVLCGRPPPPRPLPALRWCEAVSQPQKKKTNRKKLKQIPTQRAGAELGISGERGEGNYLGLLLFSPPPKKVTGVVPVLKRPALPERARRGFPRRCFPSGEISAVRGGKPFAPSLDRGGGCLISSPPPRY